MTLLNEKRGLMPVAQVDENGVARGYKITDGKLHTVIGDTDGTVVDGGVTKLNITNNDDLLRNILKELSIINLQLSLLTDNYIQKSEVE